ncbi:MAG: CPXCG motif-containing cysteine-rich protein [Holophagae bacterium]
MSVNVTTVCRVLCPYCGQPVELLIDGTVANQRYVEDCEVCCRPMIVEVDATPDEPVVEVRRENE